MSKAPSPTSAQHEHLLSIGQSPFNSSQVIGVTMAHVMVIGWRDDVEPSCGS